MDWDNPKEIGKWARDNLAVISEVTDALHKRGYDAQRGEEVLLWLAGLSMGHRQASLIDEAATKVLTRAWQIAVEEGNG